MTLKEGDYFPALLPRFRMKIILSVPIEDA